MVFIREHHSDPHGANNAHWYGADPANQSTFADCYKEQGVESTAPDLDNEEPVAEGFSTQPLLVSALTFGRSTGINRFTVQLVERFNALEEQGGKCVHPAVQEQLLINQLYYTNKFGPSATALTYGNDQRGGCAAISVAAACSGEGQTSLNDVLQKDSQGFVAMRSGARAAVVAFYQRCST